MSRIRHFVCAVPDFSQNRLDHVKDCQCNEWFSLSVSLICFATAK